MQIKKWEMEFESLSQARELEGESPGVLGAVAGCVSVAVLSLSQALRQSRTPHTAADYNEWPGWLCASSVWQIGKSFP